tara:strand:+ start:3952 stop:6618 length:2667 start_codon:yes stop_codon:yes gene_type:complete
MPSIQQTIPNYILGISEQPDQLKLPGQVRDLNNAYPDVTSGLVKRPGTKLLGDISADAGGKWFDIYRDNFEQYMCQVTEEGRVKVWRLVEFSTRYFISVSNAGSTLTNGTYTDVATSGGDGEGMTVDFTVSGGSVTNLTINTNGSGYKKNNSITIDGFSPARFVVTQNNVAGEEVEVTYEGGAPVSYLSHTDPDNIQTLTVNDYTFIANRGVATAMTSATAATRPNEAFLDLLQIAYNKTYSFRLLNDSGGVIATIDSNKTSAGTSAEVKASVILSELKTAVDGTSYNGTNFSSTIAGNGLYITHASAFSVDTPEAQLINIFTTEVENITRLPYQCKHGYVCKILNSGVDQDDYYVKFVGNNETDGEGVWEETVKPGLKTTIDNNTMPWQLVRQADNTFKVSPVTWANRLIGDEGTCPRPSFLPQYNADGTETAGRKINKLLFFRNRLAILSDENIILSRPGSFFDFWSKSAFTVSGVDPIDLSCSSTTPAVLYDGIEVNTGLVLFSRTQQFMLVTDADTLTSSTAKITLLSTYNFLENTRPVSVGTSIAFLNDSGTHSRLFEMTRIQREGQPEILEQSKIIAGQFPTGLQSIADSRENSLILFGEKVKSPNLWGYKYFNRGDRRIQSAWFRWTMSGDVLHMCILRDNIFFTIKNQTPGSDPATYNYSLHRLNLEERDNTVEIEDTDEDIRIFLDHRVIVQKEDITYNTSTKKSSFVAPIPAYGTRVVYTLEAGRNKGNAAEPTVDGDNLIVDGDWTDTDVTVGIRYSMNISLPKVYFQTQRDDSYRADVQASLIVHRMRLDFGAVGVYKTTLRRKGRDDYTKTFDTNNLGEYTLGSVQISKGKQENIPIYDRNTSATVEIISEHPSPATLYGMSWEGDYSTRFYQRA